VTTSGRRFAAVACTRTWSSDRALPSRRSARGWATASRMPAEETITSRRNPRLRQLRRLGLPRHRRDSASFVVEGFRLVRRALDAHAPLRALYAAPALFRGDGERELVARARGAGVIVHTLGPEAFASVARQAQPDGLLALVARWPTRLDGLRHDGGLLLVAEAVERPGNLGTIMRTTCAAGASGLVLADPQTDPFHPKAVIASVGAIFHLPIAVADRVEGIRWLRRRGARIVVAAPDARTCPWDVDLTGSVALVVGCEKRGVSNGWLEAADDLVGIPMPGPAMDSLNVAAAAAVVLFEAMRQRLATRAGEPAQP
jgi:RNA methyltransferase, TrmH family